MLIDSDNLKGFEIIQGSLVMYQKTGVPLIFSGLHVKRDATGNVKNVEVIPYFDEAHLKLYPRLKQKALENKQKIKAFLERSHLYRNTPRFTEASRYGYRPRPTATNGEAVTDTISKGTEAGGANDTGGISTHPEYYGGKDNPYEVIKIIQHFELGFELGNVLKYILRAGKKSSDTKQSDLQKAINYIKFELSK